MTDRLQEIRARLEVAQDYRVEWPDHTPGTLAEFIAHAPADIAWLLDQVEKWKYVAVNGLYGSCDEPVAQDARKQERSGD